MGQEGGRSPSMGRGRMPTVGHPMGLCPPTMQAAGCPTACPTAPCPPTLWGCGLLHGVPHSVKPHRVVPHRAVPLNNTGLLAAPWRAP